MQAVRGFSLCDDDAVEGLRRAVKKILDWGLGDRKDEIRKAAEAISRAHAGDSNKRPKLRV